MQVRIDGTLRDLQDQMEVSRYGTHTIELVVDKLKVQKKSVSRLRESLKLALERSSGTVIVFDSQSGKPNSSQKGAGRDYFFSQLRSCPKCGTSYSELAPNSFSFNSKFGMCRSCGGIGLTGT